MYLPTFPEPLTTEACALSLLLKPCNQTGDDPAKVFPVVLLGCVVGLHGPETEPWRFQLVENSIPNPEKELASDQCCQ